MALDRDIATAAHADALELRDRLAALAARLGPLDTRKRSDRAIAEAARNATRAVELLAARLGAAAEDADESP